jgi:hypothetical protein
MIAAPWEPYFTDNPHTRNLLRGKGQLAGEATNLTAICQPMAKKNLEALMSENPMDLQVPVTGTALLLFYSCRIKSVRMEQK